MYLQDSTTNSTIPIDTPSTSNQHVSSSSKQAADSSATKSHGSNNETAVGEDDKDPSSDIKDEPGDFIETHCYWFDCEREFPTQHELVNVIIIN